MAGLFIKNIRMSHNIEAANIKPDSNHLLCLDGLRAISILIVLLSHFGFSHYIPGAFGVTIFFFISGFLITRLLLAEYNASASVSLPKFYLRRFFRIMPAFLFLIGGTLTVFYILKMDFSYDELIPVFIFYYNYVKTGLFHGSEGQHVLPLDVLWSLCVEEHFYLVYPLMIIGFINRNPKKLLWLLLIISILCVLWKWCTLNLLSFPYHYNEFATETRIDSILYGCIFSLLCQLGFMNKILNKITQPIIIISCLLFIFLSLINKNPEFRYVISYSIQGMLMIPLFSALLFTDKYPVIQAFLEFPLLKWIGKLSYSLYLWHFCALTIIRQCFHAPDSIFIINMFSFLLSFILALISYYIIEAPFLKLGKQLLLLNGFLLFKPYKTSSIRH